MIFLALSLYVVQATQSISGDSERARVLGVRPEGLHSGQVRALSLGSKCWDFGPESSCYWLRELGFFFYKAEVIKPNFTTSEHQRVGGINWWVRKYFVNYTEP